MKTYHTIRLILGDQLNEQHSWYKQIDSGTLYVMMELRSETDYVKHHIQKVVAFFSAMRAFAARLKEMGHDVYYVPLDEPGNAGSFTANLNLLFTATSAKRFEYQLPDEYRLDKELRQFCSEAGFPYSVYDSEHFLSHRDDLRRFFEGKKQYLMESFYRKMRLDYKILLDGDQPHGGKWNYDAENRESWSHTGGIPEPSLPRRETEGWQAWLESCGVSTIGELAPIFDWPITRTEGLQLLSFFIEHQLPWFGKFQDAMTVQHRFLFHSRLSFLMNVKLIHPLEVIQAAESAYRKEPGRYPLAAVEGFIRQILGWREYMRGMYWAFIPGYSHMNYFGHERPLPNWFWTGETRMRCMQAAIGQSLETAYAHHIQRLMITGNFALLAGIHPDAVDEWYLGIYVDAVEWVQLPNTRGMSQFADGGLVGTKPYVSSAAYINKMSDYCKGCAYQPKLKTGDGACPFNSLYWHFYHRNREKLATNPRIGMVYPTLDKMANREALLEQAEKYLQQLDHL